MELSFSKLQSTSSRKMGPFPTPKYALPKPTEPGEESRATDIDNQVISDNFVRPLKICVYIYTISCDCGSLFICIFGVVLNFQIVLFPCFNYILPTYLYTCTCTVYTCTSTYCTTTCTCIHPYTVWCKQLRLGLRNIRTYTCTCTYMYNANMYMCIYFIQYILDNIHVVIHVYT